MKNKTIENIKIGALFPYERNSRTHSEAQVEQIIASIRAFGFTNPVLIDADNRIVTRWEQFTDRKAELADNG